MRLPRITIEYQEEETYALGRVSFALIAGFGLHWAWVYLFMFNGAALFFPHVTGMQSTLFPVSLAAFAATLLCYGLFLEPMRALFGTSKRRAFNRLVAALLVFMAMLLTVVAEFVPAAQLACGIVGGILSGVGSAVLLMSYGVSFSVCDLATTAVCTAASLPISALCFVAITMVDAAAHPLGAVLCLALPFAEVVCLRACSHQLVDNLEFTSITLPVNVKPFALHVCAPSLVFGFALGFIRTEAVAGFVGTHDPNATMAAIALSSVLACGLLVLGMLTQRQSNNFAFRVLAPVAAVLLSSLVIPGADDGAWASFAFFGSYLMLEASMWIMFSDISQRFRISAFTVFGFGRALLALGTLSAYFLSQPGNALHAAATDIEVLIAVLFAAITLGVALLPNNRELRKTLKQGRLCPAFINPEDDPFRTLGVEVTPTIDARETDDSNERSESKLGNAPVDAETALTEAQVEENAQRTAGRFKRKCSAVADRYLLSRKETEVLYLLAKGRKSAAIQECLYISEGTANTHMRHIYRKLDVHSQQELMDLVESETLEG